ncbi:MAG TPA: Hsp33 family molecular chaperone HslO [Candidatus Eremiobacteraceae bacterium]|nr:Hsp33 family molecular chaperone HslO [Candidatus Eremiobacteraceae bacterium]
MTRDYAASATAAGETVRIVAARTTDIVREAQARHDCSPTVTAALGRLLTGAALLGIGLSDRERLTLQVSADGPVRYLVADAMPGGRVRGYPGRARAEVPLNALGKFDVGGVIGRGSLHVTRIYDTGLPYTSAVPLRSGEIGDDLAHYFANSEQVPSVVAVGVLANPDGVLAAGGIIAQLLPGAESSTIERLETEARKLGQVSTLVRAGMSPEEMIDHVAAGLAPHMRHVQPLSFSCPCDRARVARALVTLGSQALREMAAVDADTEATCDFCGQRYYFSPDEVGEILAGASDRRAGEPGVG